MFQFADLLPEADLFQELLHHFELELFQLFQLELHPAHFDHPLELQFDHHFPDQLHPLHPHPPLDHHFPHQLHPSHPHFHPQPQPQLHPPPHHHFAANNLFEELSILGLSSFAFTFLTIKWLFINKNTKIAVNVLKNIFFIRF